jgi:hypothetical protein
MIFVVVEPLQPIPTSKGSPLVVSRVLGLKLISLHTKGIDLVEHPLEKCIG